MSSNWSSVYNRYNLRHRYLFTIITTSPHIQVQIALQSCSQPHVHPHGPKVILHYLQCMYTIINIQQSVVVNNFAVQPPRGV